MRSTEGQDRSTCRPCRRSEPLEACWAADVPWPCSRLRPGCRRSCEHLLLEEIPPPRSEHPHEEQGGGRRAGQRREGERAAGLRERTWGRWHGAGYYRRASGGRPRSACRSWPPGGGAVTSIRPRDPRRRRSDLVSAISTREAGTERAEDRAGVPGPFAGRAGRVAAVAAAGAVAAGVLFHFVTRSHLWLDEALTVNIASQPLGDLHRLLRHDGAPPLYYCCTLTAVRPDLARSSPLLLRPSRSPTSPSRLASRPTPRVVVGSSSSCDGAVRDPYSTEARRYMLESSSCGRYLASAGDGRASIAACSVPSSSRPSSTPILAVYLLAPSRRCWWRAPRGPRLAACGAPCARVGACLRAVLPTFLYQPRHTTPWSLPYIRRPRLLHFPGFGGAEREGTPPCCPCVLVLLPRSALDRPHPIESS